MGTNSEIAGYVKLDCKVVCGRFDDRELVLIQNGFSVLETMIVHRKLVRDALAEY